MKKIKALIVILLLFAPIYIRAFSYENYAKSKSDVKNYINKYTDKSKYLLFKQPYDFRNGSLVNGNDPDFNYGAFISKDEYDLSKGLYSSYLAIGRDYWTLTSNGSNQYYIDNELKSKSPNSLAGIRVTEFVKPNIKVDGVGSYANPWRFVNQYEISFRVESDKYGSVSWDGESNYSKTISKMVNPNAKVGIIIKPAVGYEYKNSDCKLTKKVSANKYETKPITKDTLCTLGFKQRKITVNYTCGENDGTPPASATLTYGQSYSVANYACSKKGYTQTKWKASDGTIWAQGATGVSTLENGEKGLSNGVLSLEPVMEAKTFTVVYKGNGGKWKNESGTWVDSWSETVKYGDNYKVWANFYTRSGYKFVKWTDPTNVKWDENWTGSWLYDNGQYGITNNKLELTAQWEGVCSKENYTLCETTTPCRPEGVTYIWDSNGNTAGLVCNGFTRYSYWSGNLNDTGIACNGSTKFYIIGEKWIGGILYYNVCYKYKDAGAKETLYSNEPSSGTLVCDYYYGDNCSYKKWKGENCNVYNGCTN